MENLTATEAEILAGIKRQTHTEIQLLNFLGKALYIITAVYIVIFFMHGIHHGKPFLEALEHSLWESMIFILPTVMINYLNIVTSLIRKLAKN